jgi:hypothetical protein
MNQDLQDYIDELGYDTTDATDPTTGQAASVVQTQQDLANMGPDVFGGTITSDSTRQNQINPGPVAVPKNNSTSANNGGLNSFIGGLSGIFGQASQAFTAAQPLLTAAGVLNAQKGANAPAKQPANTTATNPANNNTVLYIVAAGVLALVLFNRK